MIATSTSVTAVDELLSGSWSSKPAAVTVAVFVTVGPEVTPTTICALTELSAGRSPRSHVTVPPASLQEADALTNVVPLGSSSVTVTPVAVVEPTFVTFSV